MITAGIAGLGRWGRVLVNSVQGESDRIRFAAGCTGRKARAEAFCDENGIELRDGLADLLKDPGLDAVILATPHSQHADQVIAAAAAGKHIFVEKPFTLDRASARAAAEAARDAGVVLALGHNRRFHPAMVKMKELVTGGDLGRVLHIEGNLSAPAGFRYKGGDSWRVAEGESPAGGMTGLGIHVVDAMINLAGPIVRVSSESHRQVLDVNLDDTTVMLFGFASGATGYLGTLTATAPIWRVQVFGTGGWAEMHNYGRLTVKRCDPADASVRPDEVITYDAFDMERAELEAFATACQGGAAYPLTPAEAVHGAAVLEAIIKSAAGGGPTTVAAD